MEHYSNEYMVQHAAAMNDLAIDAELERQAMIDRGAQWYNIIYEVTFLAGNTETIAERVLAFSESEARSYIRADRVIDVITDDELESA